MPDSAEFLNQTLCVRDLWRRLVAEEVLVEAAPAFDPEPIPSDPIEAYRVGYRKALHNVKRALHIILSPEYDKLCYTQVPGFEPISCRTRDYILACPGVHTALVRAADKARDVFGDCRLTAEVVDDPEDGTDVLAVEIHTPLPTTEALDKLSKFDLWWFSKFSADVRTAVVVDVCSESPEA